MDPDWVDVFSIEHLGFPAIGSHVSFQAIKTKKMMHFERNGERRCHGILMEKTLKKFGGFHCWSKGAFAKRGSLFVFGGGKRYEENWNCFGEVLSHWRCHSHRCKLKSTRPGSFLHDRWQSHISRRIKLLDLEVSTFLLDRLPPICHKCSRKECIHGHIICSCSAFSRWVESSYGHAFYFNIISMNLASRKRSHIPPNGKAGKSSTQECLEKGDMLVSRRVSFQRYVFWGRLHLGEFELCQGESWSSTWDRGHFCEKNK